MSKPAIWVCGSGARAAALSRALARGARVHDGPLPAARLTTAAAAAASARRADQAWRALGTVDAVIIHPDLSTGTRGRNPGLAAWRVGIDATLRAAYLLGRAAGLALAQQRRGVLLIVVEPPRADDAIAAVVAEALSCLVDALGRAVGRTVRVGEVAIGRPPASAAATARGVLAALDGASRDASPLVRFVGGSPG